MFDRLVRKLSLGTHAPLEKPLPEKVLGQTYTALRPTAHREALLQTHASLELEKQEDVHRHRAMIVPSLVITTSARQP